MLLFTYQKKKKIDPNYDGQKKFTESFIKLTAWIWYRHLTGKSNANVMEKKKAMNLREILLKSPNTWASTSSEVHAVMNIWKNWTKMENSFNKELSPTSSVSRFGIKVPIGKTSFLVSLWYIIQ